MDENLTDKEQIENLQKWWKENSTFVITGLALGASVLFGWNYYKTQALKKAYNAGVVYDTLIAAVGGAESDAALGAADRLSADFAGTPYAELAPLAVAKLHVDNGDLDAAAAALEPALSAGGEVALTVRSRLARIRIAQERGQDALDLLNVEAGAYEPLFDEIRGDAYAIMGQAQNAHDAYSEALDSDGTAVDRNYVQVKMAALGLGADDTP